MSRKPPQVEGDVLASPEGQLAIRLYAATVPNFVNTQEAARLGLDAQGHAQAIALGPGPAVADEQTQRWINDGLRNSRLDGYVPESVPRTR